MMVLVLLMVPTLSTFLMAVSSMSNIMPMIMMDVADVTYDGTASYANTVAHPVAHAVAHPAVVAHPV